MAFTLPEEGGFGGGFRVAESDPFLLPSHERLSHQVSPAARRQRRADSNQLNGAVSGVGGGVWLLLPGLGCQSRYRVLAPRYS